MGLLGYSTPKLLTSLNGIIGVLHPKPTHQSEWDYWGAAPQTSSPVSMGLLGCCTPNLLTSLPRVLLKRHPLNPLTCRKDLTAARQHKPPHQSHVDYSGAPPH